MFAHTVRTEIDIAAPPEQVWKVLTDFDRWPEWNPTLPKMQLEGPLREGTSGRLTLELGPPLGQRPVGIRLVTVREDRELAWRGGVPRVMAGRHAFALEPNADGTRLIHSEVFDGLLVPPLIRLVASRLDTGYRRLNEKLRQRCEQTSA